MNEVVEHTYTSVRIYTSHICLVTKWVFSHRVHVLIYTMNHHLYILFHDILLHRSLFYNKKM